MQAKAFQSLLGIENELVIKVVDFHTFMKPTTKPKKAPRKKSESPVEQLEPAQVSSEKLGDEIETDPVKIVDSFTTQINECVKVESVLSLRYSFSANGYLEREHVQPLFELVEAKLIELDPKQYTPKAETENLSVEVLKKLQQDAEGLIKGVNEQAQVDENRITLLNDLLDHSVNEDADSPDFCSFSINFLVAKTEKRELFIPVQTTTELTALDVIESPANQFKKTLEKLKALQPEQFYSVVKDVRDALQSVRTGLNLAKATSIDILSPDAWATGLVDDISRLVNFDFSISALSQWRDVIKRVERFDHIFDETSNPKELKQLWRATQIASVVGITQQVIQKTRDEMLELQGKPVQDPTTQQNQISMTPMDLAKVRASTREKIQAAIQAEREYGSLDLEAVSLIQNYKHIADQIHLQIQELIEVRPPIITMVIPVPCTFHWLAHYLYEDMTRAAEIRRLNQDIENPALLLKGMEVSVYAR